MLIEKKGNSNIMLIYGISPLQTPPDFLSTTWGDIVTSVGTILTIGGLIWTIVNTTRAKKSAESARDAAIDAKNEITKRDTFDHLVQAIALIEEIKGFQRNNIWASMPEKYSGLRKLLIEIRDTYPNITIEQRTALIGTIYQVTQAENKVESYNDGQITEIRFSKVNSVLSKELDTLIGLMNQIRNS
jgi:hypothetical protein